MVTIIQFVYHKYMIINYLLRNQVLWNMSQAVFGDNEQKIKLYSSLVQKKGKLLDFGCANGNTFVAFKEMDYTGLDIDPIVIEHAKKLYGHYPNAKFICADILKNTLPKNHFESVLFAATGHHIPDADLFGIFSSLARVMKTNGRLYFVDMITDDNRNSLLLKIIMSLDQGKYHKDIDFYKSNMKLFCKELIPVKFMTLQIESTFMPQPTYFVATWKKV